MTQTATKISYLPEIHRLLPQSPDAEQGVLSSFLLSPNQVGEICQQKGITTEYFHIPSHALIFQTLLEFWRENEPLDFITLTDVLRDRGKLDQAGGAAFVTGLFTFLPTAANAGYYVETLKDKFTLREVIRVCTEAAARGYDEQDDIQRLLSGIVDAMLKIVKMSEGQKTHSRGMKELVMRSMDRIDKRLNGEWSIEMPTGIKALDDATMGFKAPMVTMIVGKPSDGKSSLAMNIAEHLAIICKKKVGIISLDDSDDQLTNRLIQAMARVNLWEIERTGQATGEDMRRIAVAATKLANADDRMFIRDDGGLTPVEISATFATWKSKHGLDFGIIDHIQLAKGDGNHRGKTEEAEQVSRSLKPMAKRFGIPLLVLSQVTEGSDGSYSTKNSKALQEDANNLWTISHVKDSTDAWINISKQKDGPRGANIPVSFFRQFTRFTAREKDPEQPELLPPAAKGKRK